VRRGAAVAEFGIIAPVMIYLGLGAMEVSRGIMAAQALNDAARRACRYGIQGGVNTSSIKADALDALGDINNPTGSAICTVWVNNNSGTDASAAVHGDQIKVQVSIPASSVYWSSYLYLKGFTLYSEPVVMMRQQ
jgi:Flp pilus assembly protein TadG